MTKKVMALLIPIFVLLTLPSCQAIKTRYRRPVISAATQNPCDEIAHVGEAIVSRTGIVFSLENRSNYIFSYSSHWELAYYTNGRWRPVQRLPGLNIGWTDIGLSLQAGDIRQYRQDWGWIFGELPSGRYMFIRDGFFRMDKGRVYAIVEFFITEDCPLYLPYDFDIE